MTEPIDLEAAVEQFCLYRCPWLMEDPDAVSALILFVHAVLTRAVREERRLTTERLLTPSRS